MSDIEWTNNKVKISDLKLAVYNPRKWTDGQMDRLKESIEKFSIVDPVIINKNNIVIGGHFRLAVLKNKFGGDYIIDVRVPSRELSLIE